MFDRRRFDLPALFCYPNGVNISHVHAAPLRLPYRDPMKTATNYFAEATGLLIEIRTDEGLKGYGYAELFPRAGETIETAQPIVRDILAPGLVGRDANDFHPLLDWMEKQVTGNRRAKASIEMALHDLRGKKTRLPVYELLGGKVRESVTVMRMVGLRKPEEMAKEAGELVQQGIRALKIKIGTGWKEDIERVKAVRERVGEKVFIKVDANQCYSADEALRVARLLEEFNVKTFEQPVQADDWDGMTYLTKNSPIPIEADQTVRSIADVIRVIRTGAAHVINTSPQKAGGILQAKRIADLCDAAGMPCILSSIAGCVLNDAASIQVIAASRSTHLPCEVGESHRVTGDPTRGLEVVNGEISVPTSPGLGVEVQFPP